MLDPSQKKIVDHRDPYLCHHGILCGAEESFDLQVLLDPLEEDLYLPTSLVNIGDCFCGEIEIIREKTIDLVVFFVVVLYEPKRFWITLFCLSPKQTLCVGLL
jgi:hypothetical protein